MANKFQKSVLERLEQDAQRQRQQKQQEQQAVVSREREITVTDDRPTDRQAEAQETSNVQPSAETFHSDAKKPETDRQQNVPIESEKPASVHTKSMEAAPPIQQPAQQAPISSGDQDAVYDNFPDVSRYLRREPERHAKNKTFYLDIEVINSLTKAARRQKVTDSKLCNDILRQVLGL